MRKALTLEVVGEPPLDDTARVVLYEDGGMIGRDPGPRGLRLPASHKQVSRLHAQITYDGQNFFVENLGQIGTTLNDESLEDERKYPLADGDQIGIDALKIAVTVADAVSPVPVGPQRKFDNGGAWVPQPRPARPAELLGKVATPVTPPADIGERPLIPAGPTKMPVEPGESDEIPTNWWVRGSGGPKSAPPPPAPSAVPREVTQKTPTTPVIDLEDVFRGAGLDPALATPQLAQQFGELLRVVVQGTMDLLESRQSIKLDIQAGQTVFNPRGFNNPLKFSRTADDALHLMLGEQERGYLGPVPALNEAFEDLRHHEYAMLEGVRVAFDEMLDRFNPGRLQEEFDRQSTGNAFSVGKPKYWDLYMARFHDMFSDADAAYRRFRETFGRAYTHALSQLRGKDGSKPS